MQHQHQHQLQHQQQHQQPQLPLLFHHRVVGGGVAGGGVVGGGVVGGGVVGGGVVGGGHAGGGHGGAGWLLIDPKYSQGPAVLLGIGRSGKFETFYGNRDPHESHFKTANRELDEESGKAIGITTPTSQPIPSVASTNYQNQLLYYCNIEPAPGQKKGLLTRQLFAHNRIVLRQSGAGSEFFETTSLARILIADLQTVFAANPGNKGLILVGTHGECGVLKGRDASYLRQILASNLYLTAPTLHSTFVRHANGIQTYHLQ
jgi:hypothetical protein